MKNINMKKKFIYLMLTALTLALTLTLQSCIFVAGAAAGAAAAVVVYDHRKLEKILMDNTITNKSLDRIKEDPAFADSHINVTCFNQVVLLTGETPSAELKKQAEDLVHTVPNVMRVYNQISIEAPVSSLTRTTDGLITARIKTQLLATKDIQSGTIKVITENGVVYLMGMVNREQADTAATIASSAAGVQKVMKIFQYTD